VPVGRSPLTSRSLQFTSGAFTRGSIPVMLASMRPPRAAKHQRKCAEYSRSHAYLRSLSAEFYACWPIIFGRWVQLVEESEYSTRKIGSRLRMWCVAPAPTLCGEGTSPMTFGRPP
jgi:hypothetical protein